MHLMNQGAYWDYGNSGVELESGLLEVLPLKFWEVLGSSGLFTGRVLVILTGTLNLGSTNN
jgi:hypothetical protein